jgi:hypothetical protein
MELDHHLSALLQNPTTHLRDWPFFINKYIQCKYWIRKNNISLNMKICKIGAMLSLFLWSAWLARRVLNEDPTF